MAAHCLAAPNPACSTADPNASSAMSFSVVQLLLLRLQLLTALPATSQVIAHVGGLQRVNGSAVSFNERKEAELGYLRTRLGALCVCLLACAHAHR